jgi:hypothetical protein
MLSRMARKSAGKVLRRGYYRSRKVPRVKISRIYEGTCRILLVAAVIVQDVSPPGEFYLPAARTGLLTARRYFTPEIRDSYTCIAAMWPCNVLHKVSHICRGVFGLLFSFDWISRGLQAWIGYRLIINLNQQVPRWVSKYSSLKATRN